MNEHNHVLVRFNVGITSAERGPLLLAIERLARQMTGKPVEVFMDRKPDDSKLRNAMGEQRRRDMTDKERESL